MGLVLAACETAKIADRRPSPADAPGLPRPAGVDR
jgi:hypothetical protein